MFNDMMRCAFTAIPAVPPSCRVGWFCAHVLNLRPAKCQKQLDEASESCARYMRLRPNKSQPAVPLNGLEYLNVIDPYLHSLRLLMKIWPHWYPSGRPTCQGMSTLSTAACGANTCWPGPLCTRSEAACHRMVTSAGRYNTDNTSIARRNRALCSQDWSCSRHSRDSTTLRRAIVSDSDSASAASAF